jgi:hypothetical protein
MAALIESSSDAGTPQAGFRDLVECWYRRDDNAVPPIYVLRPREGRYRDAATWAGVEGALVAGFDALADKDAAPTEECAGFGASATEHEIALAMAGEPVDGGMVCFLSTAEPREETRRAGPGGDPSDARLLPFVGVCGWRKGSLSPELLCS